MTRRERRMREQFRSQVEQEANGKPVDPWIAERMTKPRISDEPLFQVMVTERETKQLVRISPMMNRDACGMIAEAANKAILSGHRTEWMNAEVYPMTPISTGVH